MLKFCSLYSGSSGNSLFLSSNTTKILVDCGVSAKKIVDALNSINVDISEIDGIVITHEHSDHIQGLGTLSKKYNIPVYANHLTWEAMPEQKSKIQPENRLEFINNNHFIIGDLCFSPFDIPHDAANPCGFNVFFNDTKISIATDLGHITTDIISHLEKSSFVLLESNYEPEVLQLGHYPYSLKQRILGPNGHLSNNIAGQTIAHLIRSGLKEVMLGHLSKENNFPELAYKTVVNELIQNNFSENCIQLSVANRFGPSHLIDVV